MIVLNNTFQRTLVVLTTTYTNAKGFFFVTTLVLIDIDIMHVNHNVIWNLKMAGVVWSNMDSDMECKY